MPSAARRCRWYALDRRWFSETVQRPVRVCLLGGTAEPINVLLCSLSAKFIFQRRDRRHEKISPARRDDEGFRYSQGTAHVSRRVVRDRLVGVSSLRLSRW